MRITVFVFAFSILSFFITVAQTVPNTFYIDATQDADTLIQLALNQQFEVWGLPSEEAADTVLSKLTANYDRIAGSLDAILSERIKIDIYPDLSTFHEAIGRPDAADLVVGVASGLKY